MPPTVPPGMDAEYNISRGAERRPHRRRHMIKSGKKKYYVSEKKRAVAAVSQCGQFYVTDDFYANAKTGTTDMLERAISITSGKLWFDMKPGVARCADNDTFDESVGRIIASAKGDAMYHVQMVDIYDKAITGMKEAIALAEEMQQKHREKAIVCNDVVLRSAASATKEEEQ